MKAQHERVQYSMLIEWSDLDGAYIVSFPEWERAGHLVHTHGATYVEAARKGEEMLSFLVGSLEPDHETAPAPALFDLHAYASSETAESIARDTQELMRELDQLGGASSQAVRAQPS